MTLSHPEMLILLEVDTALQYAVSTSGWAVLLCPDKAIAETVGKVLAIAAPVGSIVGGRTVRVPGGGRVSVGAATMPVFVPNQVPFMVVLTGWRHLTNSPTWQSWQDRAVGVLTAHSY